MVSTNKWPYDTKQCLLRAERVNKIAEKEKDNVTIAIKNTGQNTNRQNTSSKTS